MAISLPTHAQTGLPAPQLHLAYPENVYGIIAFDAWGKGRPILCMPGPGDLRAEYNYLAPALASVGYGPLVMDVRGMGQSTKVWPHHKVASMMGDLLAIMKVSTIGAAGLVGCSTSAAVTALLALRRPERVKALVMISPLIFAGRHHRTTWRKLIHHPRLLRTPWGHAFWVRRMRRLFPTQPDRLDAHLSRIAANLRQRGRLRDLAYMLDIEIEEVEQRLDEIHAPALIVMGERDPLFTDPRSVGQHIKDAMPRAELAVIPGAGHYPHWELPTLTSAVISDWFQRAAPPQS
jgi:pimeloyl-ACP methyl ester carboxylesterase